MVNYLLFLGIDNAEQLFAISEGVDEALVRAGPLALELHAVKGVVLAVAIAVVVEIETECTVGELFVVIYILLANLAGKLVDVVKHKADTTVNLINL